MVLHYFPANVKMFLEYIKELIKLGNNTDLERTSGTDGENPRQWAVTLTLIVANIIIYFVFNIIMIPRGSDIMNEADNFWPAVMEDHEYYRLFTCMFLHEGVDHLINNMMVLFVIGSRYEVAEGHIRTIISYFSGGILASAASMLYNMHYGNMTGSIGASGAIFALVGAFAAALLINRGRLQGINGRGLIIFIGFSLYGGFANSNVDNAAHIGGLVCGFLVGLIVAAIGRRRGINN